MPPLTTTLRDQAAEAIRRWGTPLYLTDLDAAAANLHAYRDAFPGALIAYAVKANPDPQLLRRLAAEGAGAEVVTAVELALARRAAIPAERIVMNGVGKRDEELHLALGAGALINAESLEELATLVALAADHPDARIGLRLNPALDAKTHPHLATGAASSKFGIPIANLPEALAALRAAGREPASIGAHIGSAVESVDAFAELASRLADVTAALPPTTRIDLGGGLATAEPAALAAAIRPHLPDPSRLILEPGRSLVADAGWLLTRVVRVQPRPSEGLTYLVADAGMTELIRPMLYGAVHPIALVAPGAAATRRPRSRRPRWPDLRGRRRARPRPGPVAQRGRAGAGRDRRHPGHRAGRCVRGGHGIGLQRTAASGGSRAGGRGAAPVAATRDPGRSRRARRLRVSGCGCTSRSGCPRP